MGLFDKKKKDDYDSPVEEINLAQRPGPQAKGGAPAPAGVPGVPGAPGAPVAPAPPPEEPPSDFGINKAIELMRQLPFDNAELVVTVVKTTLEALHIKVPTIIRDADRKLKGIEDKIDGLKKEIADFEREIAQRKETIAGLEADHKETTTVKERMLLAEKLASGQKK